MRQSKLCAEQIRLVSPETKLLILKELRAACREIARCRPSQAPAKIAVARLPQRKPGLGGLGGEARSQRSQVAGPDTRAISDIPHIPPNDLTSQGAAA